MRHVLGLLLRQRFNFIVVDVPVPITPAIRPAISLARHVETCAAGGRDHRFAERQDTA